MGGQRGHRRQVGGRRMERVGRWPVRRSLGLWGRRGLVGRGRGLRNVRRGVGHCGVGCRDGGRRGDHPERIGGWRRGRVPVGWRRWVRCARRSSRGWQIHLVRCPVFGHPRPFPRACSSKAAAYRSRGRAAKGGNRILSRQSRQALRHLGRGRRSRAGRGRLERCDVRPRRRGQMLPRFKGRL
jgi:hypothetical protein